MTRFYYTIFNLFALSVIIYAGVDIFYRIVRAGLTQVTTKEIVLRQPPDVKPHKGAPLSDFRVITDRNIFGSLEKSTKEVKTEDIEALEPTSLNIALLGTVTGDPQSAYAVIEETAKKKQALYRTGDSVQNAVVKMILRGKVILRVGDKDKILTMEEAAASRREKEPPPSKPIKTASTITVNRSDLQNSLKNINELLSQLRIQPHFKDGKADGLSITRIKSGSIFAKLGLRNGDIIKGINGRPIEGPDDILEMYENLKSGSRMSLEMTRKDKPKTINYEFR